jgi:hypothetical protein
LLGGAIRSRRDRAQLEAMLAQVAGLRQRAFYAARSTSVLRQCNQRTT